MQTTEDVVAEVNHALGTDYQLVRRLAGGLQQGAFELRDGTTRVVLKWTARPEWAPRVLRADELVRRARAAGYPTPAWLAVGTTSDGAPYQLQEFAEGTPMADANAINQSVAEQLVGIVETQRGLALDGGASWSGYVRGVVFQGWDERWETVRGYDEVTAGLIARYDEVCRPYQDQELPENDLVHGDLNVGNLLVADGQIAAVIDIEAASSGTRAYDLVTLATSAARDNAPEGIDEYLFEAALRAGGRASVAVCAAASYADLVAFVRGRSLDGLPRIHHGGERILELLKQA